MLAVSIILAVWLVYETFALLRCFFAPDERWP